MNAPDQWASYLDPDTPAQARAEIAAELDERDVVALDGIRRILADEAVWGEPSTGLRERLLATAGVDTEHGEDPPSAPPRGRVDELAERRSRRRLGLLGGGLVAAAAAVALLLFAAGPADDDPDITTFELAATERNPDLEATIDVRPLPAGVALTLHIEGLPPAEDGTYYAAWLMPATDAMDDDEAPSDEAGDQPMVGVGSFHWREGGMPIGLWSGVDTDRYPMFIVTLQDEDAPPIASDVVVMTGSLTGG